MSAMTSIQASIATTTTDEISTSAAASSIQLGIFRSYPSGARTMTGRSGRRAGEITSNSLPMCGWNGYRTVTLSGDAL
jgi:hypothetical protein